MHRHHRRCSHMCPERDERSASEVRPVQEREVKVAPRRHELAFMQQRSNSAARGAPGGVHATELVEGCSRRRRTRRTDLWKKTVSYCFGSCLYGRVLGSRYRHGRVQHKGARVAGCLLVPRKGKRRHTTCPTTAARDGRERVLPRTIPVFDG